jgi:hypothetical protein
VTYGTQTENAKWFFDSDSGEIRCYGDTFRKEMFYARTPELMWARTEGTYLITKTLRHKWSFWKEDVFTFEQRFFFWYEEERAKAMKLFSHMNATGASNDQT